MALEIAVEQLVVVVGQGLEHLDPVLLGDLEEVRRDRLLLEGRAAVLLDVDHLHHLDQVDDAVEEVPDHDRNLKRHGVRPEPLPHHLDGPEEVRPDAVHLVDEGDARDAVLVGLTPDGLGLGLDPADRAEDGDRPVEDPQRALDLDREVDVAGRVDDVDLVVRQ